MKELRVFGSELKVGDGFVYWAASARTQIVALEPYRGPLAHLFVGGAQIATFMVGPPMTIDNSGLYTVFR